MTPHWSKLVLLVPALLALQCPQGSAVDLQEEWVARYDSPEKDYDSPSAIAVDESGCVYVAGHSASDCLVIKYKPDGETLWVRRYYSEGPDRVYDLALDRYRNVYITGCIGYSSNKTQFVTLKYNSSGDLLWEVTYPKGHAEALAVDEDGSLIVVGTTLRDTSSLDLVTIKCDQQGYPIWVRHFNGPANQDDQAAALALDDKGNIYVAGYSVTSTTGVDYVTIKYNPKGETLWVRFYDGPEHSFDRPRDIKVDAQGNVYVTGVSNYDVSGRQRRDSHFATIKYKPNGDTAWVRQYDGGRWHCDEPMSLVLDRIGNAYVSGISCEKTGSGLAVLKYTSEGDMAWMRFYDELRRGPDFTHIMGIDHQGYVFVTGWKVINEEKGGSEYMTIAYAPDGSILCLMEYNGPDQGLNIPMALAVDYLGNVYVTGVSDGPLANRDWATVKYSIHAVQHFKNPLKDDD